MKARIIGKDEYNPELKELIIEVVENQISDNNPPITKITYDRLLSTGYTDKRAKEKIAAVLASHIYDIMKYDKIFDKEKYTKELSELE
ncbi:MAG: hypothetical protein PUC88_04705 [Clostridia bacterium]|nr:hypothetical protein [Clostridia bacterium]